MQKAKRKPGRKKNSGKYNATLPGVPVEKPLLDTLMEISQLKSGSLNSAIREILEAEAPVYLERMRQLKAQ